MMDLSGLTGDQILAEADYTAAALTEAIRDIAGLEVTAEAGNGTVTAVADGHGRLTQIRVEPRALRYADADRLAEHLLTAIRMVEREAELQRDQRFASVSFGGVPLSELSNTKGNSWQA